MHTVEGWGMVLDISDITEDFAEDFYESCVSGWYDDGPIDWEDAIERWEKYHRKSGTDGVDITFGPQMHTPAEMKLRRMVRAIKAEAES
jgi:hypothetical protein